MPERICQLADNRRLDDRHYFSNISATSLMEGAFPEGMPEKRSGGGACGRICHPLPGGRGPLMALRSC